MIGPGVSVLLGGLTRLGLESRGDRGAAGRVQPSGPPAPWAPEISGLRIHPQPTPGASSVEPGDGERRTGPDAKARRVLIR